MKERLQKLMARADFGSRRACETMIAGGRVTINGKRAELGDQADPAVDDVRIDDIRLKTSLYKERYYVFNKPRNVLSVTKPQPGDDRPNVRDMIPVEGHLFVIGRLDAESEGMLVLTNDGDIAHRLAHPSFEHTKTYKVTLYGHPSENDLQQWEEGVWLEGKRTARCHLRILEKTPKMTTMRVVMIEGRKRQIRQVASLLGYNVNRLVRTHIGQLGLGTLSKGSWYELTEDEVAAMLMPAEELKFIRRKRRTFTPKDKANPQPATVEARHRVPVEGDRSQTPRMARSLILRDLHRKGGNSPENPAEIPTARRLRPNRTSLVSGDRTMLSQDRPTERPKPRYDQQTGRTASPTERVARPRREGDDSRVARPRREGDDSRVARPRREGDDSRVARPRREGDDSRPTRPSRPADRAAQPYGQSEAGSTSSAPADRRTPRFGDQGKGSTRPVRKPRYASSPEGEGEDQTPKAPVKPGKPKPVSPKAPGNRPVGGGRPPVQKGRSNKPPLQRKHGQ